jgi:ribonucleotide reductase beta subunit family protein with ferritin-like domain
MRYPHFYERYRDAIRNTWTVEEVDLSDDLVDLARRLLPAERHLIKRLVAFLRHRRLDRGQQLGAQPVQAHKPPRPGSTSPASSMRRRSTSSST